MQLKDSNAILKWKIPHQSITTIICHLCEGGKNTWDVSLFRIWYKEHSMTGGSQILLQIPQMTQE